MTPTSLHAAAFFLRSNAITKGEAGSSSLFELERLKCRSLAAVLSSLPICVIVTSLLPSHHFDSHCVASAV